ncbi:MAG: hypothetical protein AB7T86_15090 [Xanthobacteraceae bacterium]|uniref:PD-(D/E)XK nuclease domain-containing protein n=1 Tax=Pseudolabrys sp. TaxID=1960880 RepID=UPI003D0D68B4
MKRTFTFRCNLEKRAAKKSDGKLAELYTFGPKQNLNVVFNDIAAVFQRNLTDRIADILEIAAFVYSADSTVPRDGGWLKGAIEPWSRSFKLEIGVRDPNFWNQSHVKGLIVEALSFLSDDQYELRFSKLKDSRIVQGYLDLKPASERDWPFDNPSRVILFSGGLDSLGGAIECASNGEKLVLVCHRSIPVLDSRQQELFLRLKETFPKIPILRVPVWVHKVGTEAREYTQRTRSFLFWALALAVGQSIQASGTSFYENGVVSLNLPIADQVLRARASRTTHPVTLHILQRLAAEIVGRPYTVDNPYIDLTKTDVIARIRSLGGGDLIRSSCSCSRTRSGRAIAWHCGRCSQCIDRRLAALAADAADLDPESDYATPVLTGARKEERDRIMAINYVRHALELAKSSPEEIAEKFNTEIARAARVFSQPTDASRRLIETHLRHGKSIERAIASAVSSSTSEIMDGRIDSTSLLGLVIDRQHLTDSWQTFAERIGTILERGLPAACATTKPENEPRLQEICDGLLKAGNENLAREYPFLRWGSRLTKPDWSDPALWVELKYVRSSSDVRKVGEDIAADITKYGDNGQNTLFVVYDPSHHIIDEDAFITSIEKHPGNIVKIIR